MKDAYRRLSEDLPERSDARTAGFPLEPRRVAMWVEALPRANRNETQRLLADALASLNAVRLTGARRLALLELLRPVSIETMQALAKQTLGATLPLPPAKARAMKQLRAFEEALALGYRLALIEACRPNGAVPFLRARRVTRALERAAFHHARCLMHAYAQYQTPTAGIWRSLHAIHALAVTQRLAERPLDDSAGGRRLSVRQLYVQALLLALSNPYRFSQKEQAELWELCLAFARRMTLHSTAPDPQAFAIPCLSDEGPGYIPEERAEQGGALLWLDVAPLRAALEQACAGIESGLVHVRLHGESLQASAELLRRLHGGLGAAATRNHQRLSAVHALDTVVGLSGVHFHLADGLDFDAFLRQTGLAAPASERERHEWALIGLSASRIPVLQAEVLDQSLGGYRVRWAASQEIKARVGELIGLSVTSDDDVRHWMLGVIRWLRYAADGSVDGGIELLARRARAVGVRSLEGPVGGRPRLRGIEFDAARGDDTRLRLIVPSVLEAAGGGLEIVRVAEGGALDEVEAPTSECCTDMRVLENAGDYLIVAAERESAFA